MKKTMLACFVIALCLFTSPQISQAAQLPEMEGWRSGELRVTVFDTVSGNRGSWQERDYITGAGVRVYAVWVEGAGEKGWTPPAAVVSADDGLMGSGATYRTVTVAGQKALVENHPVTGVSVAVKIEKKGALTLESRFNTEDEVLAAAAELTAAIK